MNVMSDAPSFSYYRLGMWHAIGMRHQDAMTYNYTAVVLHNANAERLLGFVVVMPDNKNETKNDMRFLRDNLITDILSISGSWIITGSYVVGGTVTIADVKKHQDNAPPLPAVEFNPMRRVIRVLVTNIPE